MLRQKLVEKIPAQVTLQIAKALLKTLNSWIRNRKSGILPEPGKNEFLPNYF